MKIFSPLILVPHNESDKNPRTKPGLVAGAFNPSTWKAEGNLLWIRGQHGLQSEIQDSQGC